MDEQLLLQRVPVTLNFHINLEIVKKWRKFGSSCIPGATTRSSDIDFLILMDTHPAGGEHSADKIPLVLNEFVLTSDPEYALCDFVSYRNRVEQNNPLDFGFAHRMGRINLIFTWSDRHYQVNSGAQDFCERYQVTDKPERIRIFEQFRMGRPPEPPVDFSQLWE